MNRDHATRLSIKAMADCSTWSPNNVWYRKLTREVTTMCERSARPDAFIANMDAEQKGTLRVVSAQHCSKKQKERKQRYAWKNTRGRYSAAAPSRFCISRRPLSLLLLAVALFTSPQPDWIFSRLHGWVGRVGLLLTSLRSSNQARHHRQVLIRCSLSHDQHFLKIEIRS